MKIKRAYKFRLYPTPEQHAMLCQHGGNARFLWNTLLKLNQERYDKEKKFIFSHEMITSLPKLKQEYDFLKLSFSQSLQQIGRHLDRAIKDFLDPKQQKEFPVPKEKKYQNDSFTVPQKFRIGKTFVFIPKIGEIKWIKHRAIKGKVKHLTIKQDGNHWYCSVNVELRIKQKPNPSIGNFVGADMGIKTYGMLSDGSVIENPKILKKHEKRLTRYQRRMDKRVKGSNNRNKQKIKVQKQYRKIRNTRKDFQHQTTHHMIAKYGGIGVENLNIRGMMTNHKLAKAVQDCAWFEFKRQLRYKSQWSGKFFFECDRFDATSKKCCKCGWKNEALTLKDRTFVCQECGLVIDRDLNAAINLCKIMLIAFLKIQLPWDTREAFNLFVEKVEYTLEEIGGYRTSVQCQSSSQEKESVGLEQYEVCVA